MTAIKNNFHWVLFAAAVIFSVAAAYSVIAQTNPDIAYPIPELGNCKNEQECRTYCDRPANIKACVNFAEKHNLISPEEAVNAKKFIAAGSKGPGGCNSKDSCESYCNDISHINECVSFAEENGLMSPEELKEAKQVQSALAKGAQLPGGCRNKNECDAYCENPDNMETCIAFGEAAGFIPPDELKDAKKVLEAVKKGVKPPPCRGQRECDAYCSEPDHFETCITFAEAAGFVSPQEAEMARKTGGKGPGNCRGKKECDAFCENENNFEVCLNFAAEHGLISEKDLEMARKTGGKGPGNCKGKEECESFCQNPANQETCFNFAKEHGMIPEEDLRKMEEGKQMMMQGFNQAPPEVMDCLNSKVGTDLVEKMRSGTAMPSREMGDAMRECFEKTMKQMGPPQGMGPDGAESGAGQAGPRMGMPEGFSGPGGCRTPEECRQFRSPIPSPDQIQRMMPNGIPPEEMRQQIQQMMPQGIAPREGIMPSPEQIRQMMPGGVPPEMMNFQQPPSPEQIQNIQQQMQQIMPPIEMAPPPPPPTSEPAPQSRFQPPTMKGLLLGLLANFLAP